MSQYKLNIKEDRVTELFDELVAGLKREGDSITIASCDERSAVLVTSSPVIINMILAMAQVSREIHTARRIPIMLVGDKPIKTGDES